MAKDRGQGPAATFHKGRSASQVAVAVHAARQKSRGQRMGQRHVTKDVAAERERVLAAWLAARDGG